MEISDGSRIGYEEVGRGRQVFTFFLSSVATQEVGLERRKKERGMKEMKFTVLIGTFIDSVH